MKLEKLTLAGVVAASLLGLAACDKHEHGDQAKQQGDKGGAALQEKDHDQEGEGHDEKRAGPSGGRVLTEFEPHAEFFVLEDRKVRITFVDDDYKPVPAAEQVVLVTAGERSAPTQLAFSKEGDVLVSDESLPASDDFPVIVQIKNDESSPVINAKFQANMLDCPTCDYLEYACICDHGDE